MGEIETFKQLLLERLRENGLWIGTCEKCNREPLAETANFTTEGLFTAIEEALIEAGIPILKEQEERICWKCED
jgi:hypothetical protein